MIIFPKQGVQLNPALTLTRLSLRSRLHEGAAKSHCQQSLRSKSPGRMRHRWALRFNLRWIVRKIAVFFYGLFMDESLLQGKGIDSPNIQVATVSGFRLRIGQRATLVPDQKGLVHGVIAKLTHAEIEQLYAEPSVRDYHPEAVVANMADGGSLPALCFNLVVPPSPDEHNPEYGRKLRELAEQLGLPSEYVKSIE
jgi:hypothetical protein